MKFYKGDYVKDKIGREGTIIGRDDLDRLSTTLATGIYFDSELTLIRRADEPEWPTDVPGCELPLPKGVRYAFTGYQHWSSPSQLFYWNGKWSISHGPVAGDPKLPTCKAVNDNDYTPPASEPAIQPQGDRKVIATPNVDIERTSKITSLNLSGVEILVQSDGIYIQLDGDCGPFIAEEAMMFAELLTAAAKEAQQ